MKEVKSEKDFWVVSEEASKIRPPNYASTIPGADLI